MASQEPDWDVYPRKFGKYHLLSPLAQGGMGALYLAVTGDRGLERLMVIKTVLPHLADAEYVARFRDEAKVVVNLSHGNLIPVFDAGMVGGELFLAMDFVEGRDLRAVWNRCAKKQVAFPVDVAVYIAKELCRGLAYAHAFPDLDLVHRDVSPPNILVSYTGEVKLTDFGLASSTLKIEKTAPGIIYGKVAYMSPEQARGEKLDGRSDMYAAAICLWELLTGRQLFPPGKDQPQDLLARAKNPEVMRPSQRAPRVPPELDEICVRALAANKADRFATCDDMRSALQSWLAVNAPTTDAGRIKTFLEELFAEDIVRERAERVEMIARVRTRALTMPPTDELRQLVERSRGHRVGGGEATGAASEAPGGGPPVRAPGSVGRRASDRGDGREDRRRAADRRNGAGQPATAAALAAQPEPEHDLTAGAVVDGRYRIVELLGEGGMGKVYLAEHVEIGKRVALKVLHPSYSRMPDLVERFRREARAASKIGHPNIVDVTDSGTTSDGSVYFVMEYLEGVELATVCEREGAIDPARALRIGAQICRALSAAHAAGIIHRDLKPENIYLITRDGAADVVKVLDFGIAKTTEAEAARERRLTSPGMAMGTPEYMAPEQAAGRPADARCDVYALGAILYEMTTGSPPYSGDNFMEILTKKATQDPPPPSSLRPELPAAISKLILDAMCRNPDGRPQSMEAFEYELNKCLAGRGIAVAQVLGMTTDPHLVASLNPGLSVRNLDDSAAVGPGAAASLLLPRAESQFGYASSPTTGTGYPAFGAGVRATGEQPSLGPASGLLGPAYTTGPAPVIGAVSGAGTSQVGATPGLEPPRRASRAGWVALGAVLLGGVGMLGYVAMRERSAPAVVAGTPRPVGGAASADAVLGPAVKAVGNPAGGAVPNPVPESSGSGAASGSGAPVPAGSAAPVGSGDPGQGSGSERPPGHGNDQANVPRNPTKPPRTAPDRGKVTKGSPGSATSAASPQELLARCKELASHPETYDGAKEACQRAVRARGGVEGEALYYQAFAAFNAKDLVAAQALAQRSSELATGSTKLDAKILFGDVLNRLNEFERAKEFYLALRKKVTDPQKKALLARKVATCNRALKLPDQDGLY